MDALSIKDCVCHLVFGHSNAMLAHAAMGEGRGSDEQWCFLGEGIGAKGDTGDLMEVGECDVGLAVEEREPSVGVTVGGKECVVDGDEVLYRLGVCLGSDLRQTVVVCWENGSGVPLPTPVPPLP